MNTSLDTPVVVSGDEDFDPYLLLHGIGGFPNIHFSWKVDGKGKRRLIGNPNSASRSLHQSFGQYFRISIVEGERKLRNSFYGLNHLPSSTAFTAGSNHVLNAEKHLNSRYFYITDLRAAYPSVSLEKLAMLIVYIKKHDTYAFQFSLKQFALGHEYAKDILDDPLYEKALSFLRIYCAGICGKGLAVGGVLSPYLMNLYCEAYIDGILRLLCRDEDIVFSRYADDLVFSSPHKPIFFETRRKIREYIENASLTVNHRKSKILSKDMGTVFVTGMGIRFANDVDGGNSSVLVFPKKKRRKLHGIIKSYLKQQMDWPEKVSGYVAEFLYYWKRVKVKTSSDKKTFALCKEFEREWAKYRKNRPS